MDANIMNHRRMARAIRQDRAMKMQSALKAAAEKDFERVECEYCPGEFYKGRSLNLHQSKKHGDNKSMELKLEVQT